MPTTTRRDLPAGPAYLMPHTDDAHRALAWIADRYTSAAELYDGATYRPHVLIIPEPVAAAYFRELPQDNGIPWQTVPPCAGGPLAAALLSLTACAYDHGAPGTVPTEHERWTLAHAETCAYCLADHDETECPNAPEEAPPC